MSTAVATKIGSLILPDVTYTADDIKATIAPNATDKELMMFISICQAYELNPYKREIHFVKYGNAAPSYIVGYEKYLKRAEATGLLDGWECDIEGEYAVVKIYRKDRGRPVVWKVKRTEFDKGQSSWKVMPEFMLKKVALAQGFRLAFPNELGGMPYIAEELPPAGDITSESLPSTPLIEKQPEPAIQTKVTILKNKLKQQPEVPVEAPNVSGAVDGDSARETKRCAYNQLIAAGFTKQQIAKAIEPQTLESCTTRHLEGARMLLESGKA
jgi:hypothetical protein